MNKKVLQKITNEWGIKKSGSKSELIDRIIEHQMNKAKGVVGEKILKNPRFFMKN